MYYKSFAGQYLIQISYRTTETRDRNNTDLLTLHMLCHLYLEKTDTIQMLLTVYYAAGKLAGIAPY